MNDNAKYLFGWATALVLFWPIAFLMSVFSFDAPSRGFFFELMRCGLVLVLLTYPWGYIVVVIARIEAKKRGVDWWTPRNMQFLVAPFIHIAIVIIFLILDEVFTHHS